jgi:hypothetical protein
MKRQILRIGCSLVCATIAFACGDDSEGGTANSATIPYVTFVVRDASRSTGEGSLLLVEGEFEFIDSEVSRVVDGKLSSDDADKVRELLSPELLEFYASESHADEEQCFGTGYILLSNGTDGCWLLDDEMSAKTRMMLEYMTGLYDRVAKQK